MVGLFVGVENMRRKRNVMWRACLDLQELLDDLMIKRARIIGDRKKAGRGVKRLKKERQRARTLAKHGSKKRSRQSSDG